MTMDKEKISRALSKLYSLNRDSERGFETAAEHVRNRGLKGLLKHQAD